MGSRGSICQDGWKPVEIRPLAEREHIEEGIIMLSAVIFLLILALIAGILGFGGIAGAAVGLAKIAFFVFLILAVLSFFMGRRPRV